MPTIETRVALLEQADTQHNKDIDALKQAIDGVQRSINRGLVAVSGLLFTTVVNLLVAFARLGK